MQTHYVPNFAKHNELSINYLQLWFLKLKFYLCVEEPGFKGFVSPVYNGDVDFNFNDNYDDQDQLLSDNADNFQSYQQNAINMQKHEQNQIEIVRVQ